MTDSTTTPHDHQDLVDPFAWTYDTRHEQTMTRFLRALGVKTPTHLAQVLWDVIDTHPMAFMYCDEPWRCGDMRGIHGWYLIDGLIGDRLVVKLAQVRLLLRMLGGRFGDWSGDPHTEAEGWLTLRMQVLQTILVNKDDPEGGPWAGYGLDDWLEATSEAQLEEARTALIDALRDPGQALADYHVGLSKRYADSRHSDD